MFRDLYKQANDDIKGNRAILEKAFKEAQLPAKKTSNIIKYSFVGTAAAAVILIGAVFANPSVFTNKINEYEKTMPVTVATEQPEVEINQDVAVFTVSENTESNTPVNEDSAKTTKTTKEENKVQNLDAEKVKPAQVADTEASTPVSEDEDIKDNADASKNAGGETTAPATKSAEDAEKVEDDVAEKQADDNTATKNADDNAENNENDDVAQASLFAETAAYDNAEETTEEAALFRWGKNRMTYNNYEAETEVEAEAKEETEDCTDAESKAEAELETEAQCEEFTQQDSEDAAETEEETETTAYAIEIFSYMQHVSIYGQEEAGVKTEGFNNTDVSPITSADEAVTRAENECTVEYDQIGVFYDPVEIMWMVNFGELDTVGGDQSVYMNSDGVTTMVVYGE